MNKKKERKKLPEREKGDKHNGGEIEVALIL